jgi:hypothetical protein
MSGQWKPFGDEPINIEDAYPDGIVPIELVRGGAVDPRKVLGVFETTVMTQEEVEKEFHILPMPPLPAEAWRFIEEIQRRAEIISGSKKELDKPENP